MEGVYVMSYNTKEDDLQQAVQDGNLGRVQQLLTSGIGINTVLHSKTSQQSTTILSLAAHEGRVDIMRYLIASNALIHYQDPLLCRNALHWACIGGQAEAVKFLLTFGSQFINCQDRDNVTALIRASIRGDNHIVEILIQHGADVTLYDRLHSSALHYSTFHGRRDVTSTLIKSGCIANDPTIFGQGTPLANLVYHADLENIRLLLSSGYSMNRDTWVLSYELDTDLGVMLCEEYRNPPSMARLCCTAIRNHIGGIHLQKKILHLPLPRKLIQTLILDLL